MLKQNLHGMDGPRHSYVRPVKLHINTIIFKLINHNKERKII